MPNGLGNANKRTRDHAAGSGSPRRYADVMPKTFVGSRVRQLRSERGFSQAALAQTLEISPSYLNQIEHDVRPLTVAVLLRITEVFGVDATFFAAQDDTRLVAELREVMCDRDLDADIDPAEVAGMVATHPAIARAMVNLYRRYRLTAAQLAVATEERFNLYTGGSGTGSITMPHEEVRDYFYQRQNYLHELDSAAEDLTARVRMHGGELRSDLYRRLTEVHGVRIVRRIDLGDTVLHRYHPATKTLEISAQLSAGQRTFKMAAELAFLEVGDLIDTMVTEGKFTSEESRRLARLGLANYFAAATGPLWNVYETFANPGKLLVQIAQMPDGRNYMWVARTVERRAHRYGQPGKTFAIGLGCEVRQANRLVYSRGLDLSSDNATPIGSGCRVCERDNCPQRAFPALGRALDIDEHRSTVSPYLVKEP